MRWVLPLPTDRISLVFAAALLTGAASTPAAAGSEYICTRLANSLEQTKPDTQLQRNIALFDAAGKDCLEIAKRVLLVGASVEASNRFGTTALGEAARKGYLDMVDFLLAHGAAINAHNVGGATPLYIAADNDRTKVVHLLLAKGADPNLARNNGLTPLAAAAYNGNSEIVADLLAYHANPNRPDNTEKTAILYAAAKGFTPVVQLLLKAGVDPKAQYGNRLTALMWAAGYADGAGIDDAQNVAKLSARSRRAHRRRRQSRAHCPDDRRRNRPSGNGRSVAQARRQPRLCAISRARARSIWQAARRSSSGC